LAATGFKQTSLCLYLVDGVYSNVRLDDKLRLLVVIGSDDTGRKEVLAMVDGYR
jgi:hypothetical protein